MSIRVAIAGVGNCASSFVQGLGYYRSSGVTEPSPVGGYKVSDIEVVAAFDIDARKVGRPLSQAVFAEPNCTKIFFREIPFGDVVVERAPTLDGLAAHMAAFPESTAFRESAAPVADLSETLRRTRAEILICYLPVGAEAAVRYFANLCVESRVAMVNCVPVFIASDADFRERFKRAGVPLIGDDIKSQVGATIIHRTLAGLIEKRGGRLERTYQLNFGGNTDFMNMLERSRLASKKISKTESVQSQVPSGLADENIHVGPSDYVPWLRDNKVAHIRLEWSGWGGVPMNAEIRLDVEDSPNSAAIVSEAVRAARVALDRGLGGVLEPVAAYAMKRPPMQLSDDEARSAFLQFTSSMKS